MASNLRPRTIIDWHATQARLDEITLRAVERCTAGEITQARLDEVVVMTARLWTRAANEMAGLQGRPVYQEDNVAPTVF